MCLPLPPSFTSSPSIPRFLPPLSPTPTILPVRCFYLRLTHPFFHPSIPPPFHICVSFHPTPPCMPPFNYLLPSLPSPPSFLLSIPSCTHPYPSLFLIPPRRLSPSLLDSPNTGKPPQVTDKPQKERGNSVACSVWFRCLASSELISWSLDSVMQMSCYLNVAAASFWRLRCGWKLHRNPPFAQPKITSGGGSQSEPAILLRAEL